MVDAVVPDLRHRGGPGGILVVAVAPAKGDGVVAVAVGVKVGRAVAVRVDAVVPGVGRPRIDGGVGVVAVGGRGVPVFVLIRRGDDRPNRDRTGRPAAAAVAPAGVTLALEAGGVIEEPRPPVVRRGRIESVHGELELRVVPVDVDPLVAGDQVGAVKGHALGLELHLDLGPTGAVARPGVHPHIEGRDRRGGARVNRDGGAHAPVLGGGALHAVVGVGRVAQVNAHPALATESVVLLGLRDGQIEPAVAVHVPGQSRHGTELGAGAAVHGHGGAAGESAGAALEQERAAVAGAVARQSDAHVAVAIAVQIRQGGQR